MSKFKVGDKVRVVTQGKQSWPDVGREFVVEQTGDTYVHGHGTSTSGHRDYGVYDSSLELVKPEPKFKVGDRVRVTSNIKNLLAIEGSEFVIDRVESSESFLSKPTSPFYYIGGGSGKGGVWESNLEKVEPQPDPKFKVGDKVKVKRSDRVFTIGAIAPGHVTGNPIAWEFAAGGTTRIGAGMYFEEIEHVEHVDHEPTYEFQVGDVVQHVFGGSDQLIVDIVKSKSYGEERKYAKIGAAGYPVWFSNLKLVRTAADEAAAQREKAFESVAVGDLVEVSKGDRKVTDRVTAISEIWHKSTGKLSVGAFNIVTATALDVYRRTGWDIRIVEKAPEPVKPEPVLPTKPGLYVSQALVIFRLKDDGQWYQANPNAHHNSPNAVKEETLKKAKNFPLLPLHPSSTPK